MVALTIYSYIVTEEILATEFQFGSKIQTCIVVIRSYGCQVLKQYRYTIPVHNNKVLHVLSYYIIWVYVIVISQREYDVLVITQV